MNRRKEDSIPYFVTVQAVPTQFYSLWASKHHLTRKDDRLAPLSSGLLPRYYFDPTSSRLRNCYDSSLGNNNSDDFLSVGRPTDNRQLATVGVEEQEER